MAGKVAVITGANAGLGLALASRLLAEQPGLRLCLACRSRAKAQQAVRSLLQQHPHVPAGFIDVLLVDVSDVGSVFMAARELRDRYEHIDYLYLNAGIMPVSTVDWGRFWRGLLSAECVHMFTTGEGLLKQVDATTADGLKQIFATNLFGHFVLVEELVGRLGGARPSQLIWTSSSNAKAAAFDVDDMQHEHGREPYASSKYAIDALSLALNRRYNQQGIYSHTTCPGLVVTNLTSGIMPYWFWLLLFPLLCLFRILVPTLNLSPNNGCEAMVWLSRQRPESLDPRAKYRSVSSVLGASQTLALKLDVPEDLGTRLYKKLECLEEKMKKLVK